MVSLQDGGCALYVLQEVLLLIQLLPRQDECIDALSRHSDTRLVLYGGAAGGSKSFTGCYWQIARRLKYKGSRGLIGRSELKNLKLTTLNTFFEVAKMFGLTNGNHFQLNAQSNVIHFTNGSEIILKDLFSYPSDPDFDSLGSLEITDFFVDEVAQVSKTAIDILQSRVRYKLNEFDLKPKGLMTCNPSKGWLYNEIYKPHTLGRLNEQWKFIPALPTDNPHLPSTYFDQFKHMSEQNRKRLLEGDWDFDQSPDRIFEYDSLLQMFNDTTGEGSNYITCDPAAMGNDRTVIGIWKGLNLIKIHEFRHKYPHEVATILRQLAKDNNVQLSNVVVDSDGLGIGVKGLLNCREFLNGSSAIDKEHYANLKSECYFKLGGYVRMNKIHCNDYSQRDTIIKELDIIRDTSGEDKKKTVTRKEDIKSKHGFSPDYADMIMMRMLFELKPNYGRYSYA